MDETANTGNSLQLNQPGTNAPHPSELERMDIVNPGTEPADSGVAQSGRDNTSLPSADLVSLVTDPGSSSKETEMLPSPDEAVLAAQKAVEFAQNKQPARSRALLKLGEVLTARYLETDNEKDILAAVEATDEAAASINAYPAILPVMLSGHGRTLHHLAKRTGDFETLDQSIKATKKALATTPSNGLGRWVLYKDLHSALRTRYEKTQDASDLEEAVEAARDIADHIPDGHPDRIKMQLFLGTELDTLYLHWQSYDFLEEAIDSGEDLIFAVPAEHPLRIQLLSNQSDRLATRYETEGNEDDIDEAINLAEQIVASTQNENPELAGRLSNHATKLYRRHQGTWDLEDIDESIQILRRAISCGPVDHPEQPTFLGNLANSLESRFEQTGDVSNLLEAVNLARSAIQATAENDSQYTVLLLNLGDKLENWYRQTGDMEKLEEAIKVTELALETGPKDNLAHAYRLIDMAHKFEIRYERKGDMADLDRAIADTKRAVSLMTEAFTLQDKWSNALVSRLHARYMRTKLGADLDAAMHASDEALKLMGSHFQEMGIFLSLRGSLFRQEYLRTKEMKHLDEAIDTEEQAVDSTAKDHAFYGIRLCNLGASLQCRYKEKKDVQDLEKALEHTSTALEYVPSDHPLRASILNSLGMALEAQHSLIPVNKTRQRMLATALEAWQCLSATPFDRVTAGARGLELLAGSGRQDEAIALGISMLELFPIIRTCTMDRDNQQLITSIFSGVASNLASLLIKADRLHDAVQYLEQGLIATTKQMVDDDLDLTNLRQSHPDLATQYQSLVEEINSRPHQRRNVIPGERQSSRRQEATSELCACLESIRSIPGYERFILGQTAAGFQECAAEGYIVIVNITDFGSDAILISSERITTAKITHLSGLDTHGWPRKEWQIEQPSEQETKNFAFTEYLVWLWDFCVVNIFHSISLDTKQQSSKIPEVWWIGTGYAHSAPFHAAGIHRAGSVVNTYSKAISSYTPSIQALARARNQANQTKQKQQQEPLTSAILIATMPTTPEGPSDGPPISYATEQKDEILRLLDGNIQTNVFEHPSVKQVLEALISSPIAHFACHTISDGSNPACNGLVLQQDCAPDGTTKQDILTVNRISELQLENAHIAYLSTHSAEKNKVTESSEDAIRVASGFQLAGFPHVVGSLWPAGDSECLELANRFYTLLFRENKVGRVENVAHVLQEAVLGLRESRRETPLQWAQFVHYGV